MSAGWSLWVKFLVVFNMGVTFCLFLWGPRVKIPTLPDGTTGHTWAHGNLREGVRPLPRWWLVMSGSMFVAGFAYLVLYPGFGSFEGLLRWTSHQQLADAVAANDAKLEPVLARFGGMSVENLATDPEAQRMGQVLFDDNCAACHGRAGKGNQGLGAPDLTDDDWLYGGNGEAITASIRNGRGGMMPAWASLGADKVGYLAQYVRSLSGLAHNTWKAQLGAPVFASNCAACHGPDGKGNQTIGAPNLTDRVWLHGSAVEDVETTIREGRRGHMPVWSPRLSDGQIHLLAAYVYHLSHEQHAGR